MTSIGSYSSEPFYTIKAVQTRSGIKPVTLRAWERRYDLLQPARMPNGYRLYSERDIQLLLWVQRKLNSGVNISQVVSQYKQMQSKGLWPESIQTVTREKPKQKAPRPARDYAEMLFGALIAHNEQRATLILEDCQKYFELLTIFQEIILPAMELISLAWYRGEILLATEHIAANYIKSRLMATMQNLPLVKEGALILVGCGPEEMKELEPLMFSILLRQQGYFVEYLGPDLDVEDLLDYSASVRPRLICLTIHEESTAFLIKNFAAQLAGIRGKPKLAYAGKYLTENEKARQELGGTWLGKNLSESMERIKVFFSTMN